MKKTTSLIIGIILLGIFICYLVVEYGKEPIIGGETDEHGCLGAAGYTWNENVQACLREWELNDNQKQAAKIAVEEVGYEKGLVIIRVDVARCPGCFLVTIKKQDKQIKVSLVDWEVTDIQESLSPEECENLGGRNLNIVGGAECYDNETNVGDVVGFISPNVCCVPV